MFFKSLTSLLLVSSLAYADPPPIDEEKSLVALPDTCVALREGRHCYADITLTWQQPTIGNYCLRDVTSKYIMQCWLKQQQGTFDYAFDSTQSIAFELINSNTAKVVATTKVQLQWVYKNRQKKRRWRLF